MRAFVCMCSCTYMHHRHKLWFLPAALGWSCGSQCVGFDAGTGEKIRAQDEFPKSHTHTCSKLMMTPSRPPPPAPRSVPQPQELPLSCLTTKPQNTLEEERRNRSTVAAKHSGNTSGSICFPDLLDEIFIKKVFFSL